MRSCDDPLPAQVFVVLLWPRAGDLVGRIPGMGMLRSTQRHRIFEAHAPS